VVLAVVAWSERSSMDDTATRPESGASRHADEARRERRRDIVRIAFHLISGASCARETRTRDPYGF
jgi:hypothetical protein